MASRDSADRRYPSIRALRSPAGIAPCLVELVAVNDRRRGQGRPNVDRRDRDVVVASLSHGGDGIGLRAVAAPVGPPIALPPSVVG